MPIFGWLDPSVDSHNMGDLIIADAVRRELTSAIGENGYVRLPTQRLLTSSELHAAQGCDYFIVGGTNILNGNYPFYRQWRLTPRLAKTYRGKCFGLGVGWWKYQDRTNAFSQMLWRTLFSGHTSAARDSYTNAKLEGMGLRTLNTGCPTMWDLPSKLNGKLRNQQVIVTLTDYNRHLESDVALLKVLKDIYANVVVWPQGARDIEYLTDLDLGVDIGDRSLTWFNQQLADGVSDYVGTRLHAGIRAHQMGANSLIVAVDNRAAEISKDTGLPIIAREGGAHSLRSQLDTWPEARLTLPSDAIDSFRQELSAMGARVSA